MPLLKKCLKLFGQQNIFHHMKNIKKEFINNRLKAVPKTPVYVKPYSDSKTS